MKKIFTLIILISAANAFGNGLKTSTGQSSYFKTHSKVLNILAPRSAELEAYAEALELIVETCKGENFNLEGDPIFHHRFDLRGPELNVLAIQNFTCM